MHAEIMNSPSAPASIRYSGQWLANAASGAFGFGNALFYGSDIHSITLEKSQRTPTRWFNTDGFEKNTQRQLGSNYRLMPSRFSDVRSDGVNVWDLSAIKNTRLRENVTLQFRGEFLNAFNHALFSNPNTTPTSTAFGTVTSQRGYPRRIQLGMKLLF